MNNIQLKRFLITAAGLIAAVFIGSSISEGNIVLPLVITAAVALLLFHSWANTSLITLYLAFITFGYIVGNRGFAQITLLWNLPLFWGEIGLVGGLLLTLYFVSFQKEFPFRIDALAIVILIWIFFCGIRLLFDLGDYGILAMRDFAMVYYALFFLIGQSMLQNQKSLRLYESWLCWALILVIPLYPLFRAYTAFFFYKLQISGVPIIYYKGDLVGTIHAAGFFFFYFRYLKAKSPVYLVLSFLCLGATILTTSRAAWFGLALALGIVFAARISRMFTHLIIGGCVALPIVIIYAAFIAEDFTQTRIYGAYEHALSFTDISGTKTYKNLESRNSGDNNRFRMIWWRTVINQTWKEGKFFGLGFGADITEQFFSQVLFHF